MSYPTTTPCGCTLDVDCDHHAEQLDKAERQMLRPSFDYDEPEEARPTDIRQSLSIQAASAALAHRIGTWRYVTGNAPLYEEQLTDKEVLSEMDTDIQQAIADGRLDRDYEIEKWRMEAHNEDRRAEVTA